MRVLSILQPWAWLIAHGHKDVENRRWSTRYRGSFLIHAGKRWGEEQREDVELVQAMFPEIQLPETFEFGGIIGQATITSCVSDSMSPWFFGPYGFEIANASPLPFIPLRGRLGLFDAPETLLATLKAMA